MREWSLIVRVCCVCVFASLFFFSGTANPSKPFSGVPLGHSMGHRHIQKPDFLVQMGLLIKLL
jgi:hypothetical protein